MGRLRALIAVAGILLGAQMNGQDIHFSQFYMSPLNLNPAMTGVMNCTHRFAANYRNQWASVLKSNAYSTYSVSYDQRIPIGRADFFGAGGTLWSDVAGSLNFGTIKGMLSLAYSKQLLGTRTSSHYLAIGADLGLAQRRVDLLKARWGDQHDGEGGFDRNIISSDQNTFDKDSYLFGDVSAGLLWFSVLDANNSFYLGGSYSHINEANQSFSSDSFVPHFTKITFHGGGEFQVSSRFNLIPGIVSFVQGPSFELNGGTSAKFLLGTADLPQSFQLGGWIRFANHFSDSFTIDALILSTRFDYNNLGIGFSYDINVSDLKVASNSNGAFEFSVVYYICNTGNRGVYCPNF